MDISNVEGGGDVPGDTKIKTDHLHANSQKNSKPTSCKNSFIKNTKEKKQTNILPSMFKETSEAESGQEPALPYDIQSEEKRNSEAARFKSTRKSYSYTDVWSTKKADARKLEKIVVPLKYTYDIYPADFDPHIPGQNVFNRDSLPGPVLVNPPYAEDSKNETFRGLGCHVKFLLTLAMKERVGLGILVPVRPQKEWWKMWLNTQHTKILILTDHLSFLRGKNLEAKGKAPMKSAVLIFGFRSTSDKKTLIVDNSSEFWSCEEKLTYLFHESQKLSSSLGPEITRNKQNFSSSILSETEKRKKEYEFTLAIDHDLIGQKFKTLFPPRRSFGMRRDLHLHLHPYIKKHVTSKKYKRKKVAAKTLMKDFVKGKKLWDPFQGSCSFCGSRDHNRKTCHQIYASAEELHLVDPVDVEFHKFLIEIPLISLPESISENLDFAIELETRKNLEKQFWKMFRERKFFSSRNFRKPDVFEICSILRQRVGAWWSLGASRNILLKIAFGLLQRTIHDVPPLEVVSPKLSAEKTKKLAESIDRDVDLGILIPVTRDFCRTVHSEFLLEQTKTDGSKKFRRICNATHFNQFIPSRTFTMPTPAEVSAQLSGFCITIDVSKAFLHIPLSLESMRDSGIRHPIFKQYLCYTGAVFGVCSNPFECDGVYSVPLTYLRLFIRGFLFLDDFIIQIALRELERQVSQKQKSERATKLTQFILEIFEFLGIQLNDKSDLHPKTESHWLGTYINSEIHQVFPHENKCLECLDRFTQILLAGRVTLKELAILKGKLNFVLANWSNFLFKELDLFCKKFAELLPADALTPSEKASIEYNTPLDVPQEFFQLFLKIMHLLLKKLRPIKPHSSEVVALFSDASTYGGGWFWVDEQNPTQKHVSEPSETSILLPEELTVFDHIPARFQPSSTWRELFVIHQALLDFKEKNPEFSGHIKAHSDSLSAVVCLQLKTCHQRSIHTALEKIFNLVDEAKFSVEFTWSSRNHKDLVNADRLSRAERCEFTQEGWEKLFQKLDSEPENFFQPFSAIETLRLWKWAMRKLSKKDQESLIFVHPFITKKGWLRFVHMIKNESFRGKIVCPCTKFTLKWRKSAKGWKYHGSIPYTHENFHRPARLSSFFPKICSMLIFSR